MKDENNDNVPDIDGTVMQRVNADGKIVVRCMSCGEEHLLEADTHLCFYGNVTVGQKGGIIGDNFDKKGNLVRTQHVCRKLSCLLKIFNSEVIEMDIMPDIKEDVGEGIDEDVDEKSLSSDRAKFISPDDENYISPDGDEKELNRVNEEEWSKRQKVAKKTKGDDDGN